MRIGFDIRIAYYTQGGISAYAQRLLEALTALDAESEYIVLHSRKDPHPAPSDGHVRHVACWTPPHHRLERWTLGTEAARLRLDLLHSVDFIPPAFGARRFVITVHDLSFLHFPQFLTAESRRYYNRQIDWAVRRADHILADSHATRSDLIALLGVPADKITTAPLGLDPVFYPRSEGEARETVMRYGLEPGYVLFVGTLEPRKNLPGLLQAYRLLLDERVTPAPLVIVGHKGWLYEEVFRRAEELQLGKQLRFVHAVPRSDLPALYSAAAVLTLPSFYEGFGFPPLEAMACGTPVVVSNRASLPEVVGEAGLLINPEDPEDLARALARALTDEPLRATMRAAGLAQAACFTWMETARRTLEAYQRTIFPSRTL